MFNTTFAITLFLFIWTSVFSILSLHSDDERYAKRTKFLFSLSAISLIFLGIIRIYSTSFDGFINIISSIWSYFYIFSFLLIIIILYLHFSRWQHQWRSFIALAVPFITIILMISIPFMNSTRRVTIESNRGVFTAHILPAHVFISIIGELFFFFSFVGSLLYLIMEWQLRRKGSMRFIYKLPNLETIENFNRWAISRALILLSLGVFLGMIMAFISYNSLFLGTAKEAHIYFSWFVILSLFILRRIKRIASHKVNIINLIFFILLMFMFIFTNIFITKGFHSFR